MATTETVQEAWGLLQNAKIAGRDMLLRVCGRDPDVFDAHALGMLEFYREPRRPETVAGATAAAPPIPCGSASRSFDADGRMVANEFIAYEQLAEWNKHPELGVVLTERSRVLLTYALCGFANFGSIGIQIGGIGALAPERRGDLARLGLRAMLGGTLACLMTACVAGVLL